MQSPSPLVLFLVSHVFINHLRYNARMPSGQTHDKATLISAIPASIAASAILSSLNAPITTHIAFAAGYLLALWVNPDMDLRTKTTGDMRLARVYIIGNLLVRWSNAYASVFKHRGVSHVFVIGTITRWLWFFPFPIISILIGGPEITLAALAGNCVADAIHIALDAIPKPLIRS